MKELIKKVSEFITQSDMNQMNKKDISGTDESALKCSTYLRNVCFSFGKKRRDKNCSNVHA